MNTASCRLRCGTRGHRSWSRGVAANRRPANREAEARSRSFNIDLATTFQVDAQEERRGDDPRRLPTVRQRWKGTVHELRRSSPW